MRALRTLLVLAAPDGADKLQSHLTRAGKPLNVDDTIR
jgi:hypothetical protein